MLYDTREKLYYKKQTLLTVNLLSKSRPDQVKLVGRVSVNLADILNHNLNSDGINSNDNNSNNQHPYSTLTPYKLTYCSVNADIKFKL